MALATKSHEEPKFLDAGGGGTTAGAVRAVNYATLMRQRYGINVRVTNNSWGGGGFNQALRDAINAGGGISTSAALSVGTTATVGTSLTTPQVYGSSAASGALKLDGTSDPSKSGTRPSSR